MARYRTRTWLRENVPVLGRFFPPGQHDCGSHEWFRADEETDRCWHCTVGVRPHQPVPIDPDSSVWQELNKSAAAGDDMSRRMVLQLMAEHEAYEALMALEMRTKATDLDLDVPHLEEQAATASAASRSLMEAARRPTA